MKRADGNGRVWRDGKCVERNYGSGKCGKCGKCGAGLTDTDRTARADGEGLLFYVAVRFLFFVADTGGRECTVMI